MRFIRGVVIANWKLYPIPGADNLKYGWQAQFLQASVEAEKYSIMLAKPFVLLSVINDYNICH